METEIRCIMCGGREFTEKKVLWPALVKGWDLCSEEEKIIDRQQGMACRRCGTDLRSNALAKAVQVVTGTKGRFGFFPLRRSWLRILEVNEAGGLHQILKFHP